MNYEKEAKMHAKRLGFNSSRRDDDPVAVAAAHVPVVVSYRTSTKEWVAVPGHAPVHLAQAQQVMWTFINCKSFSIDPQPGAFLSLDPGPHPGTVIGTVDPTARGYYVTEIECDGKKAVGGSSPAVIID